MNIEFISPELIMHVEGAYVELYTAAGFIAVYEGHAPLIAPLLEQKEINVYSENGSQRHFITEQAIAHIKRNGISIIASHVHEKTSRPHSSRVPL